MPPRRLTRDYLSCMLFCFHSVFLPTLCARDSCIDAPPAERRKRRCREPHGDSSGLYRPPRKTLLYRRKALISNPFFRFSYFSNFQSCRAAIDWNLEHVKFIGIERSRYLQDNKEMKPFFAGYLSENQSKRRESR